MSGANDELIGLVMGDVAEELRQAQSLHGPMRSPHEAYAVILEELDEFWQEVRLRRELRSRDKLRMELIQVGAMACRALVDLGLAVKGQPAPPRE